MASRVWAPAATPPRRPVMSLTVPLSLRLSTDKADLHVTRQLHDLTFRSIVPGGFASAQFSLSRPINLQPNEIAEFGKVFVYDRRNGNTVWEGRLEDSGRAAGDNGEIWSLTAVGPSVYATDRTTSLVYVDQQLDGWRIGKDSIPSVNVDITETGIEMSVGNGVTHNSGFAGLAVYHPIAYTEQKLARVEVAYETGFTSINNEVWLSTSLGTGGSVHQDVQAILSSSGTLECSRGGSPAITSGHDTVRLRFVRVNGVNLTPSDDNIWVQFSPKVRGLLKWVDGNDITSGYTSNDVLAVEIVWDLLGRLLDRYDGEAAYIDQTASYAIDQLSYPDGANAARVLDDLMLLEPAYYWAAWQTLDSGQHFFEWRPWPTEVRYEASTVDGFDAPAQTGEMFNRVSVRYRDPNGASKIVKATQVIPAMDNEGIVREAFIDMSDEVGSAANAAHVANLFLGNHAVPMSTGTLTVSRPVIDLWTGSYVMPWEILPGNLIRVRNVLPRIDALNATDRDGVSVFKISSMEYNANQASATLELDSYTQTVARAVANLSKNQITRKR
jgi:hypothetical protein